MTLSVVIVHYRDEERLLPLLRSLPAAGAPHQLECIVVDNASVEPGIAGRIRSVAPATRVILNTENVGFSRGVNQGVEASTGELVAIVNPDVTLRGKFFEPLVNLLTSQADVGVVGPAVFRADGRQQLTSHRRFPTLGTVFFEYCLPLQVFVSRRLSWLHPHDESHRRHAVTHRASHLTGVCLVTRRRVWEQVGGFDERFFLYLEETDWQQRLAEQELAVWYCAEACCTHYGSIDKRFAQGSPLYLTSLARYWSKWRGQSAVRALQFVVGVAGLLSLLALSPLGLLALFRQRLRLKVRLYVPAYGRILKWALRPPML